MTLSVDDILGGALLRKRHIYLSCTDVSEGGGGEPVVQERKIGPILIHELPAEECWAMAERTSAADSDVSNDDHARFALRVLGVPADQITDDQVRDLLSNTGTDGVQSLCVYGYNFSGDPAAKNS